MIKSTKDSGTPNWINIIRHDGVVQTSLVVPVVVLVIAAALFWWSGSGEEVDPAGLREQSKAVLLGLVAVGWLCLGIPITIYRIIETRSILSTGHLCEGVVDSMDWRWRGSSVTIQYIYDGVEYHKTSLMSWSKLTKQEIGDKVTLVVNSTNPKEIIYLGKIDVQTAS